MGDRIVFLAIRSLESQLDKIIKSPLPSRKEKGQSAALFAVLVTVLALFVLGVMDYMITSARTMEAVAVADLSAHAGAQEIKVLPNGVIEVSPRGPAVAAHYFSMQAPSYVQLSNVTCGSVQGRPACEVIVMVKSAGMLIPQHWITIRAVGYLVYGVTRGNQ